MRLFNCGYRRFPFWVKSVILVGIVILLVFLTIQGAGQDAMVNIQLARSPDLLDPARIAAYEEKQLCSLLYESLLEYDPEKGCCKGVLAQEWKEDAGGMVYTFFLRKGARFHNGKPVTSSDVKCSWERVMNPRTSNYSYLLQNVKGAEAVRDGKSLEASGLVVIDERTLRVILKEPDFTFPALVSSPALGIVSQEIVEKCGTEYGKHVNSIVGTGPFRLAKWDQKKITLLKNRRHVSDSFYLSSLSFIVTSNPIEAKRLFERGKVDILAGVPSQFAVSFAEKEGEGCARLLKKPVLSLYFLGFNMEQAPFGKKAELRAGINYALDKGRITGLLLGDGGRSMTGFLPPELVRSEGSSEQTDYEQQDALQLLAVSGHPYGSHLPPLDIVYNDSPGHELMGRFVQDELGKVGVDVNLKKRPWSEYQMELREGKHPFFRLGWEADYPEPGNILACNFASWEREHNNFTKYSNSKFDSLLQDARKERDFTRRQEIYRQAEGVLLTDLPAIPLFQRVAVFVCKDRITGLEIDLLGRLDFSRLTIKQ
jgi:oligopeptide transport system substrate-binding protein